MNDSDLIRRLARLRPADLPGDLHQRLLVAEPSLPPLTKRNPWAVAWRCKWQPWPVAYAGLLTAWAIILTLHRLTVPLLPPASLPPFVAQNSSGVPNDLRASLVGGFSLDRVTLLTRNDTPQP